MLEDRRRTTTWAALFASCRTEADVVRIANEYLETWLPSDFEALPAECRVRAFAGADELAHAAVTFTQHELQAAPGTRAAPILASMREVFVAAQVRLRELRSSRFDPASG